MAGWARACATSICNSLMRAFLFTHTHTVRKDFFGKRVMECPNFFLMLKTNVPDFMNHLTLRLDVIFITRTSFGIGHVACQNSVDYSPLSKPIEYLFCFISP